MSFEMAALRVILGSILLLSGAVLLLAMPPADATESAAMESAAMKSAEPTTWTSSASADEEVYTTTWMRHTDALHAAEKSRYGMLLFFPPVAAPELEHRVFSEEELATQSKKSPMVRVKNSSEEEKQLRSQYGITGKYFEIVITDYYGNPIGKPFKTKTESQNIPAATLIKLIQSADSFVDQMRILFEKKMEKAERNFENKKWRSALKDLLPIAEFKGLAVSEQANKRVREIVDSGKEEIARARKLDPDERKKELKSIAREFKGCEVENLAEKALAELGS